MWAEKADVEEQGSALIKLVTRGKRKKIVRSSCNVEAVKYSASMGQHRLLLTMATGTGKTAVAFQICWKLWNARWNRTAGKHLLGPVNEVLDLARVESGTCALTPQPVGVRHALEEVISFVKPAAAARRVKVAPLDFPCTGAVLVDPQRFRQVLLNLLSNAVKYNREGGEIVLSCTTNGGSLRIEVTDTGAGISAENILKLFVPFERLDIDESHTEGTGLGLSLSKYLVAAMEGRIGVESVLGKGSTFWVELPLAPDRIPDHLEKTVPGPSEQPCSSTVNTVLYMEDNVANLRLIERVLARRPEVKLLSALNGSTGLEWLVSIRQTSSFSIGTCPTSGRRNPSATSRRSPHEGTSHRDDQRRRDRSADRTSPRPRRDGLSDQANRRATTPGFRGGIKPKGVLRGE